MSCESTSVCFPQTHTHTVTHASAYLAERSRLHPHCRQDKSHKSLPVITAQWRCYITWLCVSSLFICQDSLFILSRQSQEKLVCFRFVYISCLIFSNIQDGVLTFVFVFQLVAVFNKPQHVRTESPRESMSNSSSSAAPSPEPFTYYPHLQYQDEDRGEIEVNEAVLKASTSLPAV